MEVGDAPLVTAHSEALLLVRNIEHIPNDRKRSSWGESGTDSVGDRLRQKINGALLEFIGHKVPGR